MIKKILGTITIGGMVLVLMTGSAHAVAGGPTLELYTSASSYEVGDSITVEIRLDPKTFDVSAAALEVTFPDGAFEPTAFEPGALLPTKLTAMSVGTGTVSLTVGADIGEPADVTGVVAVLTLTALEEGTHAVGFGSDTEMSAIGELGDVADTLTGKSLEITDEDSGSSGGGGSSSGNDSTSCVLEGDALPVNGSEVCCGGLVGVGVSDTDAVICTFPGTTTSSTGDSNQSDTDSEETSVVQQASQVETGPAEVTVIALILSSIAAVAYVGYTSTDWFRRNEAGDIAHKSKDEKDQGNFN